MKKWSFFLLRTNASDRSPAGNSRCFPPVFRVVVCLLSTGMALGRGERAMCTKNKKKYINHRRHTKAASFVAVVHRSGFLLPQAHIILNRKTPQYLAKYNIKSFFGWRRLHHNKNYHHVMFRWFQSKQVARRSDLLALVHTLCWLGAGFAARLRGRPMMRPPARDRRTF